MRRRSIKVIRSRLEDVEVGDVVNRFPDAESGWFTVDSISTLHNGDLQLADEAVQATVSGSNEDLVGVQLIEEVLVSEGGIVASPAPAPAPVVAAQAPFESEPASGPLAQESAGSSPDALAEEAARAAQVAGSHVAPEVDLAKVANLLEGLDFGDAPEVTHSIGSFEPTPANVPEPVSAPASAPAQLPTPEMPEGAVAIDGGPLPDAPSWRNPVVVPGGSLLSRRSRNR